MDNCAVTPFNDCRQKKKMNVNKLGRQDAEMDVFVDLILKEKKSDCNNNAVLKILSKIENDEEKVYHFKS